MFYLHRPQRVKVEKIRLILCEDMICMCPQSDRPEKATLIVRRLIDVMGVHTGTMSTLNQDGLPKYCRGSILTLKECLSKHNPYK